MKKILLSILIITFLSGVVFAPLTGALAATTTGGGAGAIVDGASCSVGQVVSKSVQSAINGVMTKITGVVTNKAVPAVPNTEIGKVLANSDVASAAHEGAGFSFFGININFLPSWDAIAYCIGNALITYVADSVTQWINSGFNGNPSFLSDPTQMLTDIADQTAAGFVQGLLKGTTGIDICSPFHIAVGMNAQNSYNSNYNTRSACTLQSAVSNLEGFYQGQPQYYNNDAIRSATLNPANTGIGQIQMAQNTLKISLNTGVTALEDMVKQSDGYLDNVECESRVEQRVEKRPDGKGGFTDVTVNVTVPYNCHTTVKGKDIAVQGQNSRNMANLRLVAATKFDQVLTALVNQLIKLALNKLLTLSSDQ